MNIRWIFALPLSVPLAASAPSAAQTDYVQSATVEVSHDHLNNVALTQGAFALELRMVQGAAPGVVGATVFPPPATLLPPQTLLPSSPGSWFVEEVPFDGGYAGSYQFDVLGGDVFDSPTYAPGPTGDFAFVTSPVPGTTTVSLNPTFAWNQVTGWPLGADINIEMFDITADLDLPYDTLPINATSWTPPVTLAPNHAFEFEIGPRIYRASVELTGAGDSYTYLERYSETNTIFFATCTTQLASAEIPRLGAPPNPNAFLPGVTSGPVIGATWDPVVDHASFLPGATLDFLAISAAPLNVSTPFGTLLCLPPAPGLTFSGPAGAPFQIPVPLECALIGVTLCSQAAALDFPASVGFTNALDITIGS